MAASLKANRQAAGFRGRVPDILAMKTQASKLAWLTRASKLALQRAWIARRSPALHGAKTRRTRQGAASA